MRFLANSECASAEDFRRSHRANRKALCPAAGARSTSSVRVPPCALPRVLQSNPGFYVAAGDMGSHFAPLGYKIQDGGGEVALAPHPSPWSHPNPLSRRSAAPSAAALGADAVFDLGVAGSLKFFKRL